jgi:hypothetical protein
LYSYKKKLSPSDTFVLKQPVTDTVFHSKCSSARIEANQIRVVTCFTRQSALTLYTHSIELQVYWWIWSGDHNLIELGTRHLPKAGWGGGKPRKNCQDNRSPGRESNLAPPEFRSRKICHTNRWIFLTVILKKRCDQFSACECAPPYSPPFHLSHSSNYVKDFLSKNMVTLTTIH